jgi:hypothetical protein
VVLVSHHASYAVRYLTSPAPRPINNTGERIAPVNIPQFRLVHDFRAPSCLCARQGIDGSYSESAMFVAEDGPDLGKYMAGCASGRCGYLSKPFAI